MYAVTNLNDMRLLAKNGYLDGCALGSASDKWIVSHRSKV